MAVSAAIVTVHGGLASHAAVVARSWGIPAVTGVESLELVEGGLRVGEQFVADGSVLTVDGTAGAVYLGEPETSAGVAPQELRTLLAWAAELGVDLDAGE